jgi:amino acid transporter
VDDGRAFGDGVVDAIRLWGWLLAILLTERLIASLPVRFLVLALSMVAITAVEQLIFDGGATWTAAVWSVALAALFTVIQLIFAAVSRRPTAA